MIDCGRCAIEAYCEYVLELDGTDGKCDDFVTIDDLRRDAIPERNKHQKKVDCNACMFEIECEKAWITDGRAETCKSFCHV